MRTWAMTRRRGFGRLAGRADALLRLAETHDYPIWQALAHVLRGLAAPMVAEALYRRAAEVARGADLRMTELQAVTRLANLTAGTAGPHEAVQRLRDVLVTFTEGFDTPVVQAARSASTAAP